MTAARETNEFEDVDSLFFACFKTLPCSLDISVQLGVPTNQQCADNNSTGSIVCVLTGILVANERAHSLCLFSMHCTHIQTNTVVKWIFVWEEGRYYSTTDKLVGESLSEAVFHTHFVGRARNRSGACVGRRVVLQHGNVALTSSGDRANALAIAAVTISTRNSSREPVDCGMYNYTPF